MTRICDHDVQPGDIVDYHGYLRRVSHVERLAGWAWPVAFDDSGWGMALGDDLVLVDRRSG